LAIYDFIRNTPPRDGADNPNHTSTVRPSLYVVAPGTTVDDAAVATLGVLEEMYHPLSLFNDPSYATLDLEELKRSYNNWLRGRAKPVKPPTIRKYMYSLNALFSYMRQGEIPLELRYLHPYTLNGWVASCRTKGQSEDGISSTLAAIKAFSNSFVTRHAELTIADPLRKVPHITPPDREMVILEEHEIKELLRTFGDVTFEDIRNKAFFGVLLSTGARLREALELTMKQWDPTVGELTLYGKGHGSGDRIRYAVLSEEAGKLLRTYLHLRPKHTSGMMWLQRDGAPLTVHGWNDVMRRVKKLLAKTNPELAERIHFHLFRHTFGSHAINKGAERAAVQDMLGHQTDEMTRRYTRNSRKRTAARMMPKFSPI